MQKENVGNRLGQNFMSTIADLANEENDFFFKAEEKYGAFFVNAIHFNGLLQNFVKSVNPEAWIFAIFLSQIRKYHTLALFSAARRHHVQARMNDRQAIEASVNAAYALANPDEKDFVEKDEKGILQTPQRLTNKRHSWLEANFPDGSKFLKNQKDIINNSTAHSNIVYAFKNFSLEELEKKGFSTPFFDIEDEFHIKSDFWFLGNLALGIMDLFYGVNKKYNRVVFKDDFISELKTLEKENHRIKAEMMQDPRVKKHLS